MFDRRFFQIHEAHESDVNAISWSPFQEDLLLSGGDEGCTRVWDMRNTTEPIVHLHYHQKAISVKAIDVNYINSDHECGIYTQR